MRTKFKNSGHALIAAALLSALVAAPGCQAGDEQNADPIEVLSQTVLLRILTASLYNFRYCEVLLATSVTGGIRADVYNTMSRNTCPQEQWEALDAAAIAAEFSVDGAFLNGPRFWVLDWITNNSPTAGNASLATFGEIEMIQVASVVTPGVNPAYDVSVVDRDTVFLFRAGREVYQLEDPSGKRYIMQSFSRIVDADLQITELSGLGERLTLPAGWSFSVRTLTADLNLQSPETGAEVVTDDFSNTYQRLL
ncbi:MAG: hypothetical protein NXI24_17465 [bacterium]|nr:hypothetical protein [bacterium]